MPRTYELKTWTDFFIRVRSGAKRAELRKDDRPYEIGDILVLQEFEPDEDNGPGRYSGREIHATVTDVIRDAKRFGLMGGYVILSIDVFRMVDGKQP